MIDLIKSNGKFYKANLHCHSTISDGNFTPEELKKLYKDNGYSILAYTDHEVLVPHTELNDDDFLAFTGYEVQIYRYREQQFKEVVTIETHIIRFGNISIATSPFEMFLDYGNIIKARSLSEQTFIVQLCCGGMGYLPTAKAEKGGHYSAYVSSGQVGHEGGDLLVRETITKINELFAEK